MCADNKAATHISGGGASRLDSKENHAKLWHAPGGGKGQVFLYHYQAEIDLLYMKIIRSAGFGSSS